MSQLPPGLKVKPFKDFVGFAAARCEGLMLGQEPFESMTVDPDDKRPERMSVTITRREQFVSETLNYDEGQTYRIAKLPCRLIVRLQQRIELRRFRTTRPTSLSVRLPGPHSRVALDSIPEEKFTQVEVIQGSFSMARQRRLQSAEAFTQTLKLEAPASVGEQLRRSVRNARIMVGVKGRVFGPSIPGVSARGRASYTFLNRVRLVTLAKRRYEPTKYDIYTTFDK